MAISSAGSGKQKNNNNSKFFFAPNRTIIVIFLALALLSLPLYLQNGVYYFPAYFVLYPLVGVYYLYKFVIYIVVVTNYPSYAAINYVEIFNTWILPPLSLFFFYTIACTVDWIWKLRNKLGELTSIGVAALLLAGMFVLLPFVVSATAQVTAPAPPKDIPYVLEDRQSCESLPRAVRDNGGNASAFTIQWSSSDDTCVLAGKVEIPSSYFTISVGQGGHLTIRGNNTQILAELENKGTIVVDEASSFVNNGMSNDGMIHVKRGGVLNNKGMISSQSRVDIDAGNVLPGDPSRIQIINEGTINNLDVGTSYIENFGVIENAGGVLRNDGEIISFLNSSVINSKGGRIENEINGKISFGTNSTLVNNGAIVTNSGHLYNEGTINNSDGASIENIIFGVIDNHGIIFNRNSSISNLDIGQIINEWMIYNGCHGIVEGPISERLPVDSCRDVQ